MSSERQLCTLYLTLFQQAIDYKIRNMRQKYKYLHVSLICGLRYFSTKTEIRKARQNIYIFTVFNGFRCFPMKVTTKEHGLPLTVILQSNLKSTRHLLTLSTSHRNLARPTVVLAADCSVSSLWQNTEMQFLPFLSTLLHFLLT